MTLLVPNVAEDIIFQLITNNVAPESLELKLYTNNKTPTESDTDTDYTEASGFGYGSVIMTPVSWTITPGDPTLAEFPEITFTFTGALGNVYGYYIIQSISGKLMWAERFTIGPFNILNNGDQVKVTVKMNLE